jgi:steroid 5-alpha reductase family enzyme
VLGEGDWRRWVLVVLVGGWGLRLSWHIHRRNAGREDPRYTAMLEGASFATAVRKVFVLQGVAVWFVSLPLQVVAVTRTAHDWVAVLGIAVWVLGVFFESVGDAQLAAYKADPDRGPVLDRGLWAWSRHPNYFGDACVWWGLFLLAADQWAGLCTIVSPIVMTLLLTLGSGMRLADRHMSRTRPEYAEYARRTSGFIPLPPRRGR